MLLKRFLSRHGFEVSETFSGKKALEMLNGWEPHLVLCDFRLEDMDGKTMLEKIKNLYPSVPVIIITGYSDIKTAVDVIKSGAYDYVTKPLIPDEILITIKKALQNPATYIPPATTSSAKDQSEKLPAIKSGPTEKYIFGDSNSFKNIAQQIDRVAPTNYSIIIYGESGSGKEAIAQQIHQKSKRSNKPFVAIDCGALSKELAGSELFGHEKGSFTGAVNQKTGNFEVANGGTIFLDEVGNLSYDIQVALLRVVQERKMRRVGGVKDIELDVRIIVASNEKLWDAARNGKFREDLYHRFNEFTIDLPPLRERREDIMTFAYHFLKLTNEELEKNVRGFTPEVEEIFKKYIWFGNLREMKNVIKRATLLTDGDIVEAHCLPFEISNFAKLQFDNHEAATPSANENQPNESFFTTRNTAGPINLKAAGIDAEYEAILQALKKVNFNKSKAAKLLNIDRKTLYNKMKLYNEFNNQQ
jgi:Response regulator containing CheY-like receiver, AAA-type ATPase, and DNA-binding domains